jgi:hypothetical protein
MNKKEIIIEQFEKTKRWKTEAIEDSLQDIQIILNQTRDPISKALAIQREMRNIDIDLKNYIKSNDIIEVLKCLDDE